MLGRDTYKVVRMYQDDRGPRVIKRGLDLEQAQAHCSDPETSSMTARKPRGCDQDDNQINRWHQEQKHWFDGYEKE